MENLNFEELKIAYDRYMKLLRKFFPESELAVDAFEKELGERLFLAPRDMTVPTGGVPGGIVSFSLSVAKHCKVFEAFVDPKKLVRVSLLHELGKLGGPASGQDLFVPEDSQWQRDRLKKHYRYNDSCQRMSTAHRTLFYVSRYGFKVDEDEWIALATSSGFQHDENRFYATEVMPLGQALHTARTFALAELRQASQVP